MLKDNLFVDQVLLEGDFLEHLKTEPGKDLLRVERRRLRHAEVKVLLLGQRQHLPGHLSSKTGVALGRMGCQDEQLKVPLAVVSVN
jgi:hypothetical protein